MNQLLGAVLRCWPAIGLSVQLLLVTGCLPEQGNQTAAQPSPAAESAKGTVNKARVMNGLVVRDQETRRLIAETAAIELPQGAGAELRLVVRKACYRLEVWRGDNQLKVYPVALGGEPVGAKQQVGDHRTPEGTYLLRPHHPSPGFGGCFYVCYPSRDDARRGLRSGIIDQATANRIELAFDQDRLPPHQTRLGGLILIHGTRNRQQQGLTFYNWTDGCVALENDDVLELLTAFSSSDRPKVEILP
jgi:murein L,D-transpeptidase YafK